MYNLSINATVKWNKTYFTKIMTSLRRAKPEWFSPSDFRRVIFADGYEIVWTLHQIKAKKLYIGTKNAHKYNAVYRNWLGVLSLF